MVYSTQQYREQAANHHAAVEKRIDELLAEGALKRPGHGVSVAVSLFKSTPLSGEGWYELIQRYRAAGWQADYCNDSRDGDYLIFLLP